MTRLLIAGVTAAAMATAACNPLAVGTGVGAGIGGIVAAALGGNPQQIALGAALGGVSGFIIASVSQPVSPGVCQARNQFGQPIYVTPQGQYVTYNTGYPLLVYC
jgi:hypothetical protein